MTAPDPLGRRTINVQMSSRLREAVDEARNLTGETATGFVRAAIVERLARVKDAVEKS